MYGLRKWIKVVKNSRKKEDVPNLRGYPLRHILLSHGGMLRPLSQGFHIFGMNRDLLA